MTAVYADRRGQRSGAWAESSIQPFLDQAWPRIRSFVAGYASGGALVLAGVCCFESHMLSTLGIERDRERARLLCNYAHSPTLNYFFFVQHPFDTIKVRLQTEGRNGRFSGPMNCLKETIRKEGVLAMYKGITPPLITIGVVNSVMFGLQGIVVSKITGMFSRSASWIGRYLGVFIQTRAFACLVDGFGLNPF